AHGPESSNRDRDRASSLDLAEVPVQLQPQMQAQLQPKEYDSEKALSAHGHQHRKGDEDDDDDDENDMGDSAAAQVIGIAILEFGVVLHSVLIGLTLAVDEEFKTLLVVLVFHQTFEGLGLGSRLAFIKLPARLNHIPLVAACIYGLTTPIGIAIGLGVRTTYNPDSTRASIVSGVLDALSAGILIYTALVELLAHEFIFNKDMRNASNLKVAYALGCMCLGCALMALLGKWAPSLRLEHTVCQCLECFDSGEARAEAQTAAAAAAAAAGVTVAFGVRAGRWPWRAYVDSISMEPAPRPSDFDSDSKHKLKTAYE
ncbi:hypothetical protein EVG20_g10576, partial [Dentipellis fragilis]